ncbi:hypothetical protein CQW23_02454 [Capsicum baccatum]|uniref:Uncharacterized protein n=1 Tax=Capsicum baccatum TaxID=33114 RepID=A0A2G2XRW0_CAPBA|nr:hypothetical protein CQW23_02454 [Capsicum baccatum]
MHYVSWTNCTQPIEYGGLGLIKARTKNLTLKEVENPKCWKWRSFTKVTLPIVVRRNGSYDELVASVMQSRNLNYVPSDVVISYLMHSREKVNPTFINNDVRVLMYMMNVDANGFRPILRINIVERSFEGLLNSSPPPPWRPTIDNDLNYYKNNGDHPINIEDNSMHMEDVSLDSQDTKKYCGTGSQPGHSFADETNFYYDLTFVDKKKLKKLLDEAAVR